MQQSPDPELPPVSSRPFAGDGDFWAVRSLLIETYPITPTDFNWDMRRWDGWRFHDEDPACDPSWQDRVRLWETNDGRVVAAVHPEDRGDAHLELHPRFRHLEEEMIEWAEQHLMAAGRNGEPPALAMSVFEYDRPRQRLLTKRGFTKTESWGATRRLRLTTARLRSPQIAVGYTIRTTGHDHQGEAVKMAALLNAGFGRTIHTAAEYETFMQHSPSFRHDLNLIAVAADGTFASHAGLNHDPDNRRAIVEPVCTHPDHRRRGLAAALITEGLRRARALEVDDVYVGSGDPVAANDLYDSVGFTECYRGYWWRKLVDPQA